MKTLLGFTLAIAVVMAPQFAAAHFKLLEPASAVEESNLGDPQKAGPCGVSATGQPPVLTNAVTKVTGGSMLKLRVQETVYHPGHYRIALAVNSREELPADPDVTTRDSEKGPWSVSAVIQNPVRPPVLVDGLWAHNTKMADPMLETNVPLPNINCVKCTLQIIQFMAEHGRNKQGDFSYHHCADLQITADPAKPIDTRWPGQGQAKGKAK
jgi:hypothetical protein